MEKIYPELRVDFFKINRNGFSGYRYDCTKRFHYLTVKQIYKILVAHAKQNCNDDLLAIYVSSNLPIFSIHIGEHIYIENYKTSICTVIE